MLGPIRCQCETTEDININNTKSTSHVPQALQQYQEEMPAYGLGAQGAQSMLQRPDGLEMTMSPLQSVAVLGIPRDDKVLIPMSTKKHQRDYVHAKA